MATLAEIRARLEAQEKNKQATPAQDGAIYPHWNIPEGSTAIVRFLPDADTDNPYFWVERQMINLDFPGIKGQDEHKRVSIPVPCIEMYDSKLKCPVHEIIRPWFKDPTLEATGRKYWKKRSYVMSGFVVQNPLLDDKTPENPIRRFVISPQIFTVIKASLMDAEIEELPTDAKRGLDFRINKTSKGGYADYSTSSWARKERELSDQENEAIIQKGLFTLSDYLPKRPDDAHLQAIVEMFQASVDGEMYDPDRWAKYYKPYGLKETASSTATVSDSATSGTTKVLNSIADVKRTSTVTG